MLADAVCLVGCWTFSVVVYYACGGGYTPSFYLRMWPIVPFALAVNVLFRLYHGRFFYPASHFSPVEEMRRLVGSAVIVHVGILAVLALARQTTQGYSRFVIVISGVLTALLTQMARDAVRSLMKRLGIGQMPVVLLGCSDEIHAFARTLKANAYLGFSPVGYFSDQEESLPESLPRLGSADEAVERSRSIGVRILILCEDPRSFRIRLQTLSEWFSHIEYFPSGAIVPSAGSRTVTFDGFGGIEIVNQGRMSVLRFEKWIVDKTLSIVVFVLLLPVLLLLALFVKLSSPGPVFFRHARLGLLGQPIRIWKFRTMYADAEVRLRKILETDPQAASEWKRNFKLKNDPRVTPLGKILRKTSLDELPQIFNVLGGSMALVGPRPIVEEEVPYYGGAYPVFSSVKPGMTGLWQVSGRSDTDYAHRVALDKQYVLNWSPWFDFWILFRTVFVVLTLRGAR